MVCDVVGVRRTDFEPKDGSPVRGFSVYVTHEEEGVDGLVAERLFMSDARIGRNMPGWIPKVGDQFSFSYNRYGKPDEFRFVN